MDAKNILSVGLILFSVIDIIGSLPVIIDLKEKGNRIESGKAALVSLVLMVIFCTWGSGVEAVWRRYSFICRGRINYLVYNKF